MFIPNKVNFYSISELSNELPVEVNRSIQIKMVKKTAARLIDFSASVPDVNLPSSSAVLTPSSNPFVPVPLQGEQDQQSESTSPNRECCGFENQIQIRYDKVYIYIFQCARL